MDNSPGEVRELVGQVLGRMREKLAAKFHECWPYTEHSRADEALYVHHFATEMEAADWMVFFEVPLPRRRKLDLLAVKRQATEGRAWCGILVEAKVLPVKCTGSESDSDVARLVRSAVQGQERIEAIGRVMLIAKWSKRPMSKSEVCKASLSKKARTQLEVVDVVEVNPKWSGEDTVADERIYLIAAMARSGGTQEA